MTIKIGSELNFEELKKTILLISKGPANDSALSHLKKIETILNYCKEKILIIGQRHSEINEWTETFDDVVKEDRIQLLDLLKIVEGNEGEEVLDNELLKKFNEYSNKLKGETEEADLIQKKNQELKKEATQYLNEINSTLSLVAKAISKIKTNFISPNNSNAIPFNNSNIPLSTITFENNSNAVVNNKKTVCGSIENLGAIVEKGGKLCITGNGPGLSNWAACKPVTHSENLLGEWTLELPESNEKYEYKFLILFNDCVIWEPGKNRSFDPQDSSDFELIHFSADHFKDQEHKTKHVLN